LVVLDLAGKTKRKGERRKALKLKWILELGER